MWYCILVGGAYSAIAGRAGQGKRREELFPIGKG